MNDRLVTDPDGVAVLAAEVADASGLPAAQVEKDFWVTEVLGGVTQTAWTVAGAVMIGSLLLWAVTPGIASGDVTLLGVAAFVPALIALHLALSMILYSGLRRLLSLRFGPPDR